MTLAEPGSMLLQYTYVEWNAPHMKFILYLFIYLFFIANASEADGMFLRNWIFVGG